MRLSTTLAISAFAASVNAATNVLLPLYIYPLSGAWNNALDAIKANPQLTFLTVVNPDSGPGAGTDPGSDYVPAIAQLNTYHNVRTIGYVPTGRTSDPYSTLTANITKYASWNKYTQANISIHGIFFDEATTSTSAPAIQYMANATTFGRTAIPDATVVFNPGTTVDSLWYDYADIVVQFEDAYSVYNPTSTPAGIPGSVRARTAVLVHDTPSSADLAGTLKGEVADGIGWTYFTDDCCYNDLGLIGQFSSALASDE